jgi:hypothetical protein
MDDQSDQVTKNVMGRSCPTHRGQEKCTQGLGEEARRKETIRKT